MKINPKILKANVFMMSCPTLLTVNSRAQIIPSNTSSFRKKKMTMSKAASKVHSFTLAKIRVLFVLQNQDVQKHPSLNFVILPRRQR